MGAEMKAMVLLLAAFVSYSAQGMRIVHGQPSVDSRGLISDENSDRLLKLLLNIGKRMPSRTALEDKRSSCSNCDHEAGVESFAKRRHAKRQAENPFTNLPYVTVRVALPGPISHATIRLAMSPSMSTNDAIDAADNTYSYKYPTEENPFTHRLQKLQSDMCWGLESVGNADSSQGRWHIRVSDGQQRVLHDDKCIPRRSELKMRPGYSIDLYQRMLSSS